MLVTYVHSTSDKVSLFENHIRFSDYTDIIMFLSRKQVIINTVTTYIEILLKIFPKILYGK